MSYRYGSFKNKGLTSVSYISTFSYLRVSTPQHFKQKYVLLQSIFKLSWLRKQIIGWKSIQCSVTGFIL